MAALRAATRSNRPRKPCTCSGLPLGRNGASQGMKPRGGQKVEQVEHEPRLEMAGEGVLHEDDAARPLRCGQGSQSLRRRGPDPARGKLAVEAEARQPGQGHEPQPSGQELARRAADRKVVEGRQSCRHGQEMLDGAHQPVLGRAQVAAVIEFQELRPEGAARRP